MKILKGFVGFSEQKKKVLAAADDSYSAGLRRNHGVRGRFGHRAFYLFIVLSLR